MNLIIAASLSEYPSDVLAFRYVTWVSQRDLRMSVLIESQSEMLDLYYHYLKQRGLLDFVECLLRDTEKEEGVRIALKPGKKVIQTKSIRFENQIDLMNKIEFFKPPIDY